MSAKAKIEGLTTAWYGYTIFVTLVNLVSAILGGGLFGIVAVPFVVGIGLFCLFVNFVIGRLLAGKSSLTRLVVLILSPLGLLVGAIHLYSVITGSWGLGTLATLAVVGSGLWMNLRTIGTLTDKSVKSFFA